MTEKIEHFPGVSLSEKEIMDRKVLSIHDRLDARYAWDAGVAIGSYLAALMEGFLLGARCGHCHRTVIPPRSVCEWCYRPMESFVRLSDRGTVNTFSLCYVTWDVQRIKEPEIPAVIEIDGASPLHGILHKLGEVNPQQVRVGMRVQAVWKPAEAREGAITDILYFRSLEEENQ